MNHSGYDTALCGIQHVSDPVERIGYKRILDSHGYEMSQPFDFDTVEYDKSNALKVAGYLEQRTDSDDPFFLSFGMFNTHRVFPPVDPQIRPDYLSPPAPVKDSPETREDFAGFVTSARVVDDCIGIVMDSLRSSGLKDKTLILFTTDHGIAFPEMKCSLYDTGIGVSLIMDFPGNPKQGSVCDALVSHLDIYPTLCDIAGLEKPDWLEGKSMLPLFNGETDAIRDEIFAEVTYHAAYEPMRCIRTDRYKLIRRFESSLGYVPSNMDDCPAKTLLLDSDYTEFPRDDLMLFDLNNDPMERINLAGDSAYSGIRDGLTDRLETWMAATGDPLLTGFVPLPPGAFANRKECISAGEENFDFG